MARSRPLDMPPKQCVMAIAQFKQETLDASKDLEPVDASICSLDVVAILKPPICFCRVTLGPVGNRRIYGSETFPSSVWVSIPNGNLHIRAGESYLTGNMLTLRKHIAQYSSILPDTAAETWRLSHAWIENRKYKAQICL